MFKSNEFPLWMCVQACSGKFTPLQQWLYYDALECFTEEDAQLPESSFSPVRQECSLFLINFFLISTVTLL